MMQFMQKPLLITLRKLIPSILAASLSLTILTPANAAEEIAYIANRSIAVINASTDTYMGNVKGFTGIGPQNIVVTLDGKTAYVANYNIYGSPIVSVIDTATHSQVSTVSGLLTDTYPENLAITPDGKTVYLAAFGSRGKALIGIIDVATNAQIGIVQGYTGKGPTHVAITPNGKKIIVTNSNQVEASCSLSFIDSTTNKETHAINLRPSCPLGVVITPDGKKAYVTMTATLSGGQTSVLVIDLENDSIKKYINNVTGEIAISPDGKKVYVLRGNSIPGTMNSLSVIDTQTDMLLKVIPLTRYAGQQGLAISPDGKKAYVTNQFAEFISLIDLVTEQENGIIKGGSYRGANGVVFLPYSI